MATVISTLKQGLKQAAVYGIRAYQYFLSPWLGHHCRFQPTCSSYAMEAIQVHGLWKGAYLSGRRLLRCHPWHSGGIDFIPLKK